MIRTNEQIQKLIDHNDDLENYFKNTIIPQLFVDGELKLKKFTPPAMKVFKLTPNDVGKHIKDVKDNFRFPTFVENIQSVIANNEILEKEIQTTDFRWYQMNIIPYVQSKDKKNNGVIITFIEITVRIKDLKAQEKLVKEHEILLDTIAHDINIPLTNLILAIDSFKGISPNDQTEFQELLKIVENALNKMHLLIKELTASRKHQYNDKAELELLSFEHILEDVRLTLSDNIQATNAVITSEINVSEIKFSRSRLRTILSNLVENALKFKSAGKDPLIKISTYKKNSFIVISVKDNGIGIDKSMFKSIFLKYYRVNKVIKGSGIGLYLVNEIVRNEGGKVVVKSAPNKGAEFLVYIKA